MFKLQSLLIPTMHFKSSDAMYFVGEHIQSDHVQGCLKITAGGEIRLSGYYNLFSIRKWKEETTVTSLSLKVCGEGDCTLRIIYINPENKAELVLEKQVALISRGVDVPLEIFSSKNLGFLYVAIQANTDCTFLGGMFYTTDSIPNDSVKLGIAITHFNRIEYVVPAIERIDSFLKNENLTGKVKLFVVDNSQNLPSLDNERVKVIPNLNLGGSGGFTRGLLEVKDSGFSHCLFMDDDGSCELESIYRVFAIYAFAKKSSLAIVGSLLSEDDPELNLQTGAKYTHKGWIGVNSFSYFNNIGSVIHNESPLMQMDYGAWPFFAFSVGEAKHYPFPFFVRGDDVLFGLQNNFHYVSWLGVGVLVADCNSRENPGTVYHDVRAILTINLIQNITGLFKLLKWYKRVLFSQLYSFKYGTAAAINLAMEHVLKGPEFYSENLDCSKVRSILKPLNKEEEFISVKIEDLPRISTGRKKSIRNSFLRHITLNGILIPSLFLSDNAVLQKKAFIAQFNVSYRQKRIVYYCQHTNRYCICQRNNTRCMKEVFRFLNLSIKLMCHFPKLRLRYRETRVGTEEFWRTVYQKEEK